MRSGTGPDQIRDGTAKGHLLRSAARMAAGKKVWLVKGSFGRVALPRCCLSQHSPLMCIGLVFVLGLIGLGLGLGLDLGLGLGLG